MLKGKSEAMVRDRIERRSLAWHTAVIPMLKKLPDHDDFAGRVKATPPRRQTPDEIYAAGLRWHYALKGKTEK